MPRTPGFELGVYIEHLGNESPALISQGGGWWQRNQALGQVIFSEFSGLTPSKQALHDSLLSAQSFALKMARSEKLRVQEWKEILKQWGLTGWFCSPALDEAQELLL